MPAPTPIRSGVAGVATATAVAATAPPSPPKERTIIPIYFTVVTDGPLPGVNNLLHIQARFSDDLRWERNIRPQYPLREGVGLGQELQTKLAVGAIPVSQAMRELIVWLDKFKGERLPVVSGVAFWHLIHHMSGVTTKMPFLSNAIDIASFYAGASGDLTKFKHTRGKDPWKAMAQRVTIVKEATELAGELKW